MSEIRRAPAAGIDNHSDRNRPVEAGEGSAPPGAAVADLLRLLDASTDYLWETDADLRVTWVSEGYERTTGQPPSQAIGKTRADIVGQVSRGSHNIASHMADIAARRPFRDFVVERRYGTDRCRWISTSGYPRFDARGTFLGYRGTARNVTELAGSFEDLQKVRRDLACATEREKVLSDLVGGESNVERLAAGLEMVGDAFCFYDNDDRLQLYNERMVAMHQPIADFIRPGVPFRKLLEHGLALGVWDTEGLSHRDWIDRLVDLRHGRPSWQATLRFVDGRAVMHRESRTADGGTIGVCTDVTELEIRRAEAATAQERLQLAAAVVDGVGNPIFVKDENLNFVLVNKAFAGLYGLSPDAMVGRNGGAFLGFLDPDRVRGFEETERAVLATGEPYEIEEDFDFPGIGRTRVVRKVRVRMPSGRNYVVGTVFDVSDMKRREMEAEEARNHLANVLESLPAGVLIYDRNDAFVFANRVLQESQPALKPAWKPGVSFREAVSLGHEFGYFRSSGDAELDRLYEADPSRWLDGMMAKYRRRHTVFERLNPDGRWYQVYDTRTEDGTFIGVRMDITELKRREKALRDSMRQIDLFRQVLDELPVGAFIKADDLKFEYVNKAWSSLTGFSKEEAVGRTARELFGAPDAEEREARDVAALAAPDRMLDAEGPLTHRDGSQRQVVARKRSLVALDGSVHVVGSSTDVTELNRRQEQLRQSLSENEVFRSLIDHVPVSIYAKRPDLKLLYVNKMWSDLTGCSREDAIGKTDLDIFGEEGRPYMESDLAVMRTGATQEVEETATAIDGSIRHQFARKSALIASDGTLYLIGSTTDITDLKRREAELKEAQRRAVLADRAKSEFLANMSHEIRTPMNGVLGMAELLARSALDPKQKAFTDIIVKSGNALLKIINDILDFSKIDAGQLTLDPAPFRLAEAMEDVATLMATRAKEKDLELIVRIAPALPESYVGDAGRIRQIVTNLLGNAVKFTDAGHVLLDISGETGPSETRLVVRVSDTGIGIPADKLGIVFEKFSQVDGSSTRRHEGTGLGLAITSRLVELMGGRIGVESREGEGSTFWFSVTLPNAESGAAPRIAPLDVTGARVLVVDDNAVNRAILAEQMAAWQFDSCAASGGAEALRVLAAAAGFGVPVDLVLLDYQMPGMSGLDVASAIRSVPELSATPIIMLTSVDQSLSAHARELAIDAQLTKPTRSSELLEAVVSTLQKHRRGTAAVMETSSEPPAEAIEAPGPAEPAGAARNLPADGHRVDILVAEDNEVNQLVFTQILAQTGYTFEIVGNGSRAVEAFGEMNPRMILMDVSMPVMNGLEATAAIRRLQPRSSDRVPIVGVTAHALKGDRERCFEAGMDDYLPKPISPKALIEKIDRWAWNGRRGRRDAG